MILTFEPPIHFARPPADSRERSVGGRNGNGGKRGKLGKVRVFFRLKIPKHGWAVRDHG
jgi:hypothetical protein